MLDIIIVISGDYQKVNQTLASIAIQTRKEDTKVYLVINPKKYNCQKEIELFKDFLDIEILDIEYENNMGFARNYAIQKSHSKYILFLNNGDQLYYCYTLDTIKSFINENDYDILLGKYFINYENNNRQLIETPFDYANLNGKIFNRDFLLNNKIMFNNSKICEDDSFYTLAINIATNTKELDYILTTNNSIDNKIVSYQDYLTCFLHNRLWVVNELKKRQFEREVLANILLDSFLYVFSEIYKQIDNPDYNNLYKYCWKYEKELSNYKDILTINSIDNRIQNYFSSTDYYTSFLTIEFTRFRNKFRKNGEYL